jgi:hypothetical protein
MYNDLSENDEDVDSDSGDRQTGLPYIWASVLDFTSLLQEDHVRADRAQVMPAPASDF